MSGDANPVRNWFEQGGRAYARFRPEYSPQLAAFLASVAPGNRLAVDVRCGNGQLTQLLSPHFRAVVGLDPSAEQIANIVRNERITYQCASAECLPVADSSLSIAKTISRFACMRRPQGDIFQKRLNWNVRPPHHPHFA